MADYRLYLLARGTIVARDDFQIEGDAAAAAVAVRLFDACSDECDDYELWSGAIRVVAAGRSDGAQRLPHGPATDGELDFAHQRLILERARALLSTDWTIARSLKLVRHYMELTARLDAVGDAHGRPVPLRPQAFPDTAIFDRLVADAMAAMRAPMGNIQLVDPTLAGLRIVSSRGFDRTFLTYFSEVHEKSQSACGAALKRARRIVVPDIDRSDLFTGESGAAMRAAGVRAVQSTPIMGRGRELIGIVSTHWNVSVTPRMEQLRRLDAVVAGAADRLATPGVRLAGQ